MREGVAPFLVYCPASAHRNVPQGSAWNLLGLIEGKITFKEFKGQREEKSLWVKGKSSPEEKPDISKIPSSAGSDSAKSQDKDTNEEETLE